MKQYSYSDVHHVMNELSLCQSGLDELKVLVSTALDKKFNDAWSVTIATARELDDVKAKLSRLENPENPQYTDEELTAMCNQHDRVVKWILPVEQFAGSDEYLVSFPEDLLEAANLQEGDQVEWINRGDGSFELRKVN